MSINSIDSNPSERDSLLVDVNSFAGVGSSSKHPPATYGSTTGKKGHASGIPGKAPKRSHHSSSVSASESGHRHGHASSSSSSPSASSGGRQYANEDVGGIQGVVASDDSLLVPGQIGADGSYFYKTLETTMKPLPLPKGVIEVVQGDIAHHPFPEPPKSSSGKLGMALFKATGIGYAMVRAANTRLNPGEITWLLDGSEQYVISKPGLYYFPGPTRVLHAPQRIDGLECVSLGNTKVVTVPPGRVGFCSFKNQIYVLNPGVQYVLNSPYISYLGSESLNQDTVERESVSLLRIQAGQFAVVRDSEGHVVVIKDVCRILLRAPELLLGLFSTNEPHVAIEGYERIRLLAGMVVFYLDEAGETHYYDKPGVWELRAPASFIPDSLHKINQNTINEGSITIVRVQTGQIACIQTALGDVDVFTEPRRYVLRAPEQLLGVYSVNEPRIEHGTYERVRLQEGSIIFYQDENGVTRYYDKPGTYALKRPAFFDSKIYDVTVPLLEFQSVIRLTLRHGQISFKLNAEGETELITTPGVHFIQKPETFGKIVANKWEAHISLGAFDILNVPPGHVAVTYDGRVRSAKERAEGQRALRILPEGHHVLDHELWVLQRIESIQEQRLDLKCLVYSRNRVAFSVGAFVLFRVIDPEAAFVDVKDIVEELKREAEATLLSVFGAHDSHEISQGIADPSQDPNAAKHSESKSVDGATSSDGPPSYEQASFADVVRSAFQVNIKTFAEERGVALTRMRVEHLDFALERMKEAIEEQAERSIQIVAERSNIESQNQTLLLEAQGKAAAIQVQADAEANAKRASTMAEVERIKEVAAAQNVASETPLAVQLALIEAYAKGQALMFNAIGDRVSLLPTNLEISAGGLPNEIKAILSNGADQMFSVPSASSASSAPPSNQ